MLIKNWIYMQPLFLKKKKLMQLETYKRCGKWGRRDRRESNTSLKKPFCTFGTMWCSTYSKNIIKPTKMRVKTQNWMQTNINEPNYTSNERHNQTEREWGWLTQGIFKPDLTTCLQSRGNANKSWTLFNCFVFSSDMGVVILKQLFVYYRNEQMS